MATLRQAERIDRDMINQEILFRGFHPCEDGDATIYVEGEAVKGRWVYGAYCRMGDRQQSIPHVISYSEDDEFGDWIEFLPSTVCLYTGLNDKNGRKIFKGDICDVTVFAYDGSDTQHIGDVIYDNACFFVGDDSDFCMPLYGIDDTETCAEVIGTIFDKPKETTP